MRECIETILVNRQINCIGPKSDDRFRRKSDAEQQQLFRVILSFGSISVDVGVIKVLIKNNVKSSTPTLCSDSHDCDHGTADWGCVIHHL